MSPNKNLGCNRPSDNVGQTKYQHIKTVGLVNHRQDHEQAI